MKPLSVEERIDKILCIFASDISGKDNDKDYVYFKANKKLQELINHQTKLARIEEQELVSDFFNETGRKNLNISDRLNLFSNKMNDRIEELKNVQSS